MDCIERAHSHRSSSSGAGGSGGGEFFICFTARLSSTRPHSSKSHMSPGRGRDLAAPSLSASLSRRLRSGSVKGAQSPMFGGRRKGCAFEAAEPSSPKVTCIGQVRVKSKKKKVAVAVAGPLTRARSQREASFRRSAPEVEVKRECLPDKNQSWVYQLPLSICEALRNIGSEVNCFVPCRGGRSPCSTSPSKVKRRTKSTSSCGAVFARWLMAIDEEGEEGEAAAEEREKGEVGFFVREMGTKEMEVIRLDELRSDLKEEVLLVEEEGRVSVCIPPPNALLLMRCRSDPARVAALADRFWGSPAAAKAPVTDFREEDGNAAEEHTEEEEVAEEQEEQVVGQDPDVQMYSETEDAAGAEEEEKAEPAVISGLVEVEDEKLDQKEIIQEEAEARITQETLVGEVSNADNDAGLGVAELEELKIESNGEIEKGRRYISFSSSSCKPKEVGRRRSVSSRDKERRRHSISSEQEARRKSFETEKDARRASFSEGRRRQSFSLEKEELAPKQNPTIQATTDEGNSKQITADERVIHDSLEPSNPVDEIEAIPTALVESMDDRPRDQLPACLLQMMYEPKLSMEVSRETWVCSDDFLRWRPHHHQRASVKAIAVRDNEKCSDNNEEPTLPLQAELPDQPPTPVPPPVKQPSPPPPPPPPLPPVVAAVEKKMLSSSTAGYGTPLVLTRCNSEPGRSSAKLAPDACFWKSRHQPIGAAGVGF